MEILWAPWRMKYILSAGGEKGCVLCECAKGEDDRSHLVLYRSNHCYIVMNRFPYNNGHLMVVPYRHVADIESLSDEEICDLIFTVRLGVKALREALSPHGFNIGINLGRVAGAGIADHLHFHIVPRWEGDTNYITVVGKTKVIPEALESTYEKLLPHFPKGEDLP